MIHDVLAKKERREKDWTPLLLILVPLDSITSQPPGSDLLLRLRGKG